MGLQSLLHRKCVYFLKPPQGRPLPPRGPLVAWHGDVLLGVGWLWAPRGPAYEPTSVSSQYPARCLAGIHSFIHHHPPIHPSSIHTSIYPYVHSPTHPPIIQPLIYPSRKRSPNTCPARALPQWETELAQDYPTRRTLRGGGDRGCTQASCLLGRSQGSQRVQSSGPADILSPPPTPNALSHFILMNVVTAPTLAEALSHLTGTQVGSVEGASLPS